MDKASHAAPKLFRECEKCDGTGEWTPPRDGSTIHGPRNCPDCESIGAIPTPEGERVIELINRWKSRGRL